MKNILKVIILFCLIFSLFAIPSFADDLSPILLPVSNTPFPSGLYVGNYSSRFIYVTASESNTYFCLYKHSNTPNDYTYLAVSESNTSINYRQIAYDNIDAGGISQASVNNYDYVTRLYFGSVTWDTFNYINESIPLYNSLNEALSAVRYIIDNPAPVYSKNPNVDEFIANTLISMGIRYSQYSDALSIASSAWNYVIDDSNWYIGSGDRNDKSIIWDIESAVSYANAQSNNYKDWYNGYKVNKDLTIALAKFISDNYVVSNLGAGTLAGFNVYYNSNYNYGTTSGTSGFDGTFGSSPNALSFYPASTITYFNGAYLHDNNVIDQDEFVYTPADVRKFIGYPSTSGIIESPDNTPASGTIKDGNGDTVYNIDLDFPSLDWLANAIQSVLDFLDRLITTIADFLTQILDAILSLFSDAFESLTEFGNGLIEWLYSVVSSFSTLGSNYIPASLWSVLLPFIFLNIGVGLIMFVLRSH